MKRKYIFALILIVGMIAGMTSPTLAYETAITAEGLTVAFDISHGGYHTTLEDLTPIMNNLTEAGNTVILINETWELPDEVDILFLTQSDDLYTICEKCDIINWYNLGNKLIIASGDSDYGGYFDPTPINEVLEALGAMLRLDGTSISDSVNNDGASYRAAATEFGYGDDLYDDLVFNLTEGMEAGLILHGPCSIVADQGTMIKGLRIGEDEESVYPLKLEMLLTFSNESYAADSDFSNGELDVYDNTTGFHPAVVYEYMPNDNHLIVAGEAFYTHYKNMYDQTTEQGTWNGGVTYGQMFTNNIINYFGGMMVEETAYEFVFSLIPLAVIGVVYVLMKKRK